MQSPLKKVIIFESKWGCLNDGFHPVREQEHLFQNLRHRLLASQILPETMSKIQRPGTKGKNIRKFIMKKWSMLENGTLVILNESDDEELDYEVSATLKPISVSSDKSQAKGEKPGVKLILTMADDKKQWLYLSNYVPFGAESRKMDQVVEANGEGNVGKSILLAQISDFTCSYFFAVYLRGRKEFLHCC